MIPVPRAQLKALVATLAGLDPAQVVWSGEPAPAVWPSADGSGAFGILTISTTGIKQQGWDDINRIEGSGGSMTTTTRGARILPLSLRYESYGAFTDVLGEDVLELVRTRVFYATPQATLDGFRCAVVNVGDIQVLPPITIDNREVSASVLQVSVRYSQVDDQTIPSDGIIRRVTGTGTLGGAVGSGSVAIDSALAGGSPAGSIAAAFQTWTISAAGSTP